MNVKQIKRNISKQDLDRRSLLNTVYGSYIQSVLTCHQVEMSSIEFIKILKKCKFPLMNDEDFLFRVWYEFDSHWTKDHPFEEYVRGLPLCVIESPYNCLIYPYAVTEDGFTVVPIYNFISYTAAFAIQNDTWKVVDWNNDGKVAFANDLAKIERKQLIEDENGNWRKE